MTIAEMLRSARDHRKLSLRKAGDESGLNPTIIWRLEIGKVKIPSAPVAKRLSDYYGIDVAILLGLKAPTVHTHHYNFVMMDINASVTACKCGAWKLIGADGEVINKSDNA